ncbi:MAG: serine hydrolase [Planctomycetota bacterium]
MHTTARAVTTLTPFAIALQTLAQPIAPPPYDFAAADTLLTQNLPDFDGNVAVIIQQNGVDIYRYQAGTIDFNTKNRLASFTKTISAGVILSLIDDGKLAPTDRLSDTIPGFTGTTTDATIQQAWAMTHSFDNPAAFERSRDYTLAQSAALIANTAFSVPDLNTVPGTTLFYDGNGMQTTGRIAELVTGLDWQTIARQRILDPVGMPQADYEQFDPNPAVAGGLRSTANETARYANMILNQGVIDGARVLSEAAVETMFTNTTRDLPVSNTPFPDDPSLYPYNQNPDYTFGAWTLADNPVTGVVEEIMGAGAWGSFIWIDRRRGLTAVLITDITPTTQSSRDPLFDLLNITRQQATINQVANLTAQDFGPDTRLSWQSPPNATAARVYASNTPIRTVFDLRDAQRIATVVTTDANNQVVVPEANFYAVTTAFNGFENTAVNPLANTAPAPIQCRADVAVPYTVLDLSDINTFITAFNAADPLADIAPPFNVVDLTDIDAFIASFTTGCR